MLAAAHQNTHRQ